MPEGHSVHRIARQFGRAFVGDRVRASSPQGRFADGAALLDGRVMTDAKAVGKQLFLEFDDAVWLRVHLGIYGEFHERDGLVEPRETTRMRLVADEHVLDLIGPTRCEAVDDAGVAAIAGKPGPDPLRRDADPERMWEKLRRRKGPIGPALMDQTVLAGVGNVFRAEALFRAIIGPSGGP